MAEKRTALSQLVEQLQAGAGSGASITPANLTPLLLTTEELCSITKIRPELLLQWRSTGRFDLPYVKFGSRIRMTGFLRAKPVTGSPRERGGWIQLTSERVSRVCFQLASSNRVTLGERVSTIGVNFCRKIQRVVYLRDVWFCGDGDRCN